MRKSFQVVEVRFNMITREVGEKILCTLARRGEANERVRSLQDSPQGGQGKDVARAWRVREVRA